MNSMCEHCKEHIGLPYVFYHGTITGVKDEYKSGAMMRTTSFQAQQVPIQVFLCQRCVKKSYEGSKEDRSDSDADWWRDMRRSSLRLVLQFTTLRWCNRIDFRDHRSIRLP